MQANNHARRWALRAALICVLSACGASALPAVAAAATGISGTVTEAEAPHAEIKGAEACAYNVTTDAQVGCEATGSTGEYTITLSPGTYKVGFTATGFATQYWDNKSSLSEATPVTVIANEVTENVNASLTEEGSGTVSGRVTSASNGQGVGGVEACASGSESYRCAETNGNGEYTISNLPVGSYSIYFSAAGTECEEEQGEKVRCQPKSNYIGTSASVKVKAEKTETVNVSLQVGGQISGTITNASITHPALAKITVCADKVNGSGERSGGGGCGYTNASGQYTISGLEGGSYKVEIDGYICSIPKKGEEECPDVYVGTYYHEKQTFKQAQTISVATGQNTGAINESLREAFPTAPASTAAPALTGTPVVGQALTCSQGSWSHEPTYLAYQWLRNGTAITGQSGSTYALQAADQGKSITCVVWAGNGAGVASATSNAVVVPVPLALFAGAKVKGAVASVTLRCPGPGACSGVLKLVVRTVTKHGKRKKISEVTIGSASFSIVAGKSRTLRVRLTAKGQQLLRIAGKRGLKVRVMGTGVKARAATLKPAKAAKHGKQKKK